MWKGFFGFLLFVFAFCGAIFGFALIIAGLAWFADGSYAGPLAAVTGMVVMYSGGATCRTLAGIAMKAFAEDAKNPPPARYIPGQHKHDPPRNF